MCCKDVYRMPHFRSVLAPLTGEGWKLRLLCNQPRKFDSVIGKLTRRLDRSHVSEGSGLSVVVCRHAMVGRQRTRLKRVTSE